MRPRTSVLGSLVSPTREPSTDRQRLPERIAGAVASAKTKTALQAPPVALLTALGGLLAGIALGLLVAALVVMLAGGNRR